MVYLCTINHAQNNNNIKNATAKTNEIFIWGDNANAYETLALRAAKMWRKRGFIVEEIHVRDVNNSLTFALQHNGATISIISHNITARGERLRLEW
jgi:hypothetical protein